MSAIANLVLSSIRSATGGPAYTVTLEPRSSGAGATWRHNNGAISNALKAFARFTATENAKVTKTRVEFQSSLLRDTAGNVLDQNTTASLGMSPGFCKLDASVVMSMYATEAERGAFCDMIDVLTTQLKAEIISGGNPY